jgi:hypothetical protein
VGSGGVCFSPVVVALFLLFQFNAFFIVDTRLIILSQLLDLAGLTV